MQILTIRNYLVFPKAILDLAKAPADGTATVPSKSPQDRSNLNLQPLQVAHNSAISVSAVHMPDHIEIQILQYSLLRRYRMNCLLLEAVQ